MTNCKYATCTLKLFEIKFACYDCRLYFFLVYESVMRINRYDCSFYNEEKKDWTPINLPPNELVSINQFSVYNLIIFLHKMIKILIWYNANYDFTTTSRVCIFCFLLV